MEDDYHERCDRLLEILKQNSILVQAKPVVEQEELRLFQLQLQEERIERARIRTRSSMGPTDAPNAAVSSTRRSAFLTKLISLSSSEPRLVFPGKSRRDLQS
jgi:hypothetical protein